MRSWGFRLALASVSNVACRTPEAIRGRLGQRAGPDGRFRRYGHCFAAGDLGRSSLDAAEGQQLANVVLRERIAGCQPPARAKRNLRKRPRQCEIVGRKISATSASRTTDAAQAADDRSRTSAADADVGRNNARTKHRNHYGSFH